MIPLARLRGRYLYLELASTLSRVKEDRQETFEETFFLETPQQEAKAEA